MYTGEEDTEEAVTVLKETKYYGNTKKWSLKEKVIMDAKKKAVLKMLVPQLVLPLRVEVAVDATELTDTTHLELEEDNDVLVEHEAGMVREIGTKGRKAPVQTGFSTKNGRS